MRLQLYYSTTEVNKITHSNNSSEAFPKDLCILKLNKNMKIIYPFWFNKILLRCLLLSSYDVARAKFSDGKLEIRKGKKNYLVLWFVIAAVSLLMIRFLCSITRASGLRS